MLGTIEWHAIKMTKDYSICNPIQFTLVDPEGAADAPGPFFFHFNSVFLINWAKQVGDPLQSEQSWICLCFVKNNWSSTTLWKWTFYAYFRRRSRQQLLTWKPSIDKLKLIYSDSNIWQSDKSHQDDQYNERKVIPLSGLHGINEIKIKCKRTLYTWVVQYSGAQCTSCLTKQGSIQKKHLTLQKKVINQCTRKYCYVNPLTDFYEQKFKFMKSTQSGLYFYF